MTFSDWVVPGTAVAALLLSAAAFVYSRRSTLAAERSATEAQRSAAAAERTADVAEREEQRVQAEVEERAVKWELDRSGNAAAYVTNAGDGTAYDVHVEVPEEMRVVGEHTAAPELPAGGQLRVGVARRMSASPGSRITVRWRNRPEDAERTTTLLVP
jgi:hypothetical protein